MVGTERERGEDIVDASTGNAVARRSRDATTSAIGVSHG
jgi:hypothetical protein